MRHTPISILLSLLTVACSIVTLSSCSSLTEAPPTYAGLGLEPLGAYQSTFEMHFAGTVDWSYHLETRADGNAVEYRLHLEGVRAAHNPGDVRVVVEGDTIMMRGPGTDDECVQFPSDLDLGPAFLTPDDVVDPAGFREPLAMRSVEMISGLETTHYTLRQASLGDWRSLEVDLWLDNVTNAALRYDLYAAGSDPLFDAGEGTLTGHFLVNDVGPRRLEPITGCEINLPLPPDAARVTRLPGLIAFESGTTLAETAAFYEHALAEEGWELVTEPQTGANTILLSHRRGKQTLELNIETTEEGVHVEMLLDGE